MATFGSSARFIAMVRQFHDGMLARIQNDGECSESFPVTTESNKTVYWHQHCPAYCSPPCLQMLTSADRRAR